MKKNIHLCMIFLFLFASQVYAQNHTITGTVIAKEDGLPLPGVSVRVAGTTVGTVTGPDGKYSISASDNNVLVFTFIGYDVQQTNVAGKSVINITLQSGNTQLTEVIVTALGIRREKKALGYAVQDVKGDDLIAADQSDPLKALSGKVAGVQITASGGTPGAGAYIQLRGQNSLTGDNQPLFIVDGVPVDNSQNYSGDPSQGKNNLLQGAANTNRAADINPNDIESISVLKGPSAAALYGFRAANGAIIITTKKGAMGKPQVDFNTGVSFDVVNKLPKLQNQYVKGLNGQIYPYSSTNRYSWGAKADTLYWTGVPNQYDVHGDLVGKSSPLAKIPFTPYDNLNNFFKTGVTYNNSVSLSGGNDAATYRTSVTNVYQTSIIPTQYYQRTSVAFSGQLKISSKIKASTSLTYTSSDGNIAQQGSNLSGIMLGLTRTPISFDNSFGRKDPTDPAAYLYPDGSQRSYRNGTYDNPYWTINQNPYTTNIGRLFGNVQLDYNIGNGFSALYRLGTDTYNDNRHQLYEINSGAYPGGRIFDDRYTYRSLNSDLILSYTKKFAQDFQFDAKIGNNFYGYKLDELYTQGDGLVAPGFNNIANASSIISTNPITNFRTAAVYYDLNLGYKSLLYLETTGRNDWGSTLPKGKDSFFYPSANLSFVFSELGDLKNSDVLSFGKIRLSATQVGKVPDPYRTSSFYTPTTYTDGYTTGISYPSNGQASYGLINVLGNANLKPERTNSFEIGTQLAFFRSRLGIDATIYHSKGTDLLVTAPISGSTGYQYLTLNSGSIRNNGFELQVNGSPVKNNNFTWNSFVNFSLNRNKVLALAEGVNQITLNGFTGTVIAQIPGAPAASIYGYGYVRDNNGNIVVSDVKNTNGSNISDITGYPISNTNVQKIIGNTNPRFLMGFGNTFTYKKISLYTLVDWKFKGDIWDGTRGSLAAIGTSDATSNRNTNTVFGGVYGHLDANGNLVHYNSSGQEVAGGGAANTSSVPLDQGWFQGDGGGFGNINEQFIEDGSFVKLREVSLSYDFKSLFFGKSSNFIKGFTIGAFARNIIIWTPYKGIDPETSLTGATSAQGIDYFNNPGTSSYGINLKARF
ncbi:SusC/RagA family TonB-linked outer membrane protein [Mucilaginibacter arboris]|uniref:SusC/RagA family TonB-linked outer membrane protein n=1 Tax=Mucilaginibacter arboris TaxID=2682090 RepID=A0A7K1SWV2_9SPHI|nr:SusC/RagA family TonB-linked outer membrane protein [Mucilaginibacter arboris]MVN21550.1 SusC/RagA family TonB-linked outer membrane protein [Mucilaginibacter arboris]